MHGNMFVHMGAYLYGGQRSSLGITPCCLYCLFWEGSYLDLGLTNCGRLDSRNALGIFLSLLLYCWDYKYKPQCSACVSGMCVCVCSTVCMWVGKQALMLIFVFNSVWGRAFIIHLWAYHATHVSFQGFSGLLSSSSFENAGILDMCYYIWLYLDPSDQTQILMLCVTLLFKKNIVIITGLVPHGNRELLKVRALRTWWEIGWLEQASKSSPPTPTPTSQLCFWTFDLFSCEKCQHREALRSSSLQSNICRVLTFCQAKLNAIYKMSLWKRYVSCCRAQNSDVPKCSNWS